MTGRPAPVVIADYDPRWPGRFARIRDRLTTALALRDLFRADP